MFCHSLILGLAFVVAGASSRSELQKDVPRTSEQTLISSCHKALVFSSWKFIEPEADGFFASACWVDRSAWPVKRIESADTVTSTSRKSVYRVNI